jgi:hypothetical protein
MTTLQQMAEGQNNAHVVFNEVAESVSSSGIFSKRHAATSGLTWAFYGGLYNGNTKADATVALTDDADNYVVVLRSTGVVSTSTTSTNSTDPLYAKLYKVTTASGVVTATIDQRWDANGLCLATAPTTSTPVLIQVACSDETTALTTGTAKVTFRAPYAFTLTDVRASVSVCPTGATLLTVDLNDSGTTVLSTKLTFDASEYTTTTAATQRVLSDTAIADDAQITIDIDAVGSTIAGAGLKVTLIGTKP